jgi:hypothetical protein
LDDPLERGFAQADPNGFLDRFPEGRIVLDEIQEPFGPKGVLPEVVGRFGDNLRTQPDRRQISSILHRLHRTGRIHRLRSGRPFHESRYVREGPEG